MFEYILVGFSGSFFSYFCAFWIGAEIHAFAADTASDKVIRVMNRHNDSVENKLDKILHSTRISAGNPRC